MIGPFVYTLLAAVVAGIVHLSTVLAMPWLATRDGFMRLNGLARDNEMVLVTADDLSRAVPFSDPALAVAVCRYNLERGPARVRLATGSTPVSLAILRKGTGIFHSLSDKAATQGVLDVVIATRAQLERITELDTDDEAIQEIRIASADDIGLVLVRAVVPTPSQRADVEQQLKTATCEGEVLTD
jgi:uncharacterized membrane protein